MKKSLLALVSAFVMLSVLVTGCGGKKEEPKKGGQAAAPAGGKKQVYFATGTPGGVYQILGAGMAKVINEKNPGMEVVATTPAQVAQAPTMLENGNALISIGMACMFERAYEGVGEFQGKPHKKLRPVMAMYDNLFAYMALKDSPLNNVKDIAGKTFATTATNVVLIKAVLETAGVDANSVKLRVMSYQQSAEALSDGVAQATVLTSFPKNGTLDSLASTKGVKFLEMDEATRAVFDKKYPLWKTQQTPGGVYTGIPNPVWGPTIYTVLYTSSDAPDDVIYNITKTIIENVGEIAKIHPAGKDMTLETNKRYIKDGIMKPGRIHPGAVKYFKEKGIM